MNRANDPPQTGKLLTRQLRRTLGVQSPDELAALLAGLAQLGQQPGLPEAQARALQGLGALLGAVEDSYQQSDRDLELSRRSLAMSSAELNEANQRLRAEAEHIRRAMATLRSTTEQLMRSSGLHEAPGEHNDLESIALWMAQLALAHEQSRHALQESQTRFSLAVDSAHLGLWDWNVATGEVYFSERWAAMLGYRADALNPHYETWLDLVHPDDLQDSLQTILGYFKQPDSGFFRREMRMRAQDGEYKWIEYSGRVVERNASGWALRATGVGVDVSQRKAYEAAITAAKDAAEAASRAKSDFLANMSHEIRTPMNGILGMTELCLETELSDEQQQYLGMVHNSARSLLSVINDVLDFSKIEARKLTLELIDFSLRDTVKQSMRSLVLRANEKGLELIVETDDEVPDTLIGDPSRLHQVIVNLAGNAVKFTDRGEVALRITRVASDDTQTRLRFSIKDTGIGIPADRLGNVFEAFSQADTSITRRFGGTGLGLTISARLCEMMGGPLQVNSVEGQGSEFWFELPFELATRPLRPAPRVTPQVLQGQAVLAVDDNLTNRRMVYDMLRKMGFVPTVCASAFEALDALAQSCRPGGQPYALALLDMQMPECSGEDLALRMHGHPDYARIPLVVLSSIGDRRSSPRLQACGVQAYLAKPIDQAELYDALVKVLSADIEHLPKLPRPAPTSAPVRPLKVLLVEDNSVNQLLAQRLLQNLGHHVTLAENGLQAVQQFQTGLFDLIFMDVQMPELDGLEATRRIRVLEAASRLGQRMPIIAMTAHAMQGDRERCLEAGMDGYVSKPISRADFVAEISRVLAGPGVA